MTANSGNGGGGGGGGGGGRKVGGGGGRKVAPMDPAKKRQGQEEKEKEEEEEEKNEGVIVKLGYSWEAMDVRSADSDASAVGRAALELLRQPGCSADEVLLQDRALADVELRLFIVNGEIRYRYWARYDSCSSSTGKFSKWTRKDRSHVQMDWFRNDAAAMNDAEQQAEQLARRWTAWARGLHPNIPAFRLDLLCGRTAPGSACVSTLELTEAGFSMWGWEEGAKIVFGAIADNLVRSL